MTDFHGTTILSVRRHGVVAIGGDGQVSLGNTVMKGNARKVRRLYEGKVLAGFAGGIRAHDLAFLHPQSFSFIQSFNPLIIVVFGGLGSMTGTMITGFLWILLLEGALRLFLPQGFETWRFVAYPLVLLIMMLLRPEGLFGQYELPFLERPLAKLRTKTILSRQEEGIVIEEVVQ